MKINTIKDEAVKDNIDIIGREINIAVKIISDLLDFSGFKLIENAIHSMKKGGTFKINTRKKEGALEVAFVDEGCGISQKVLKKIFEPLFTTKPKGIGLGLAVSKGLAEANGGAILVESKVGGGSMFTVRFSEKGPGQKKSG